MRLLKIWELNDEKGSTEIYIYLLKRKWKMEAYCDWATCLDHLND